MSQRPLSVPTDEELAGLARGGCATSFEQLVRRFQTPVLHFLRRRGAGADAEDLLQETFIRAYTNLHRYQPRWRFATWLFTIARRVSINDHRRRRPATDEGALAAATAAGASPEEILAEKEDRQLLWDLAATVLSEEEVTALWLYYVEDMPVRDVARVVDRSWVAVKTMLFRARRRLLPLLAAFEPESVSTDGPVRSSRPDRVGPVEVDHAKANTLP